jgi:putative acetyltransferase
MNTITSGGGVAAAEINGVRIEPETTRHYAAVRTLLHEAFGRAAVADLVAQLRADGDLLLGSLAVTDTGVVLGYVGFSRAHIEAAEGAHVGVALAPLAVSTTHRRRGIGARLVRGGLDRLAASGETICVVLGDPAYYGRFGFSVAAARALSCVYSGPHFMALPLAAESPSAGELRYPAAFAHFD